MSSTSPYSRLLLTAGLVILVFAGGGALLWQLSSDTPSTPGPVAPVEQTITVEIKDSTAQTRHDITMASLPATVAEVMQQAADRGQLSITTHDYGGSLGQLIEEINGVKNSADTQFYWTLYINGQRSPVGASTATVSAADVITWSYEQLPAE